MTRYSLEGLKRKYYYFWRYIYNTPVIEIAATHTHTYIYVYVCAAIFLIYVIYVCYCWIVIFLHWISYYRFASNNLVTTVIHYSVWLMIRAWYMHLYTCSSRGNRSCFKWTTYSGPVDSMDLGCVSFWSPKIWHMCSNTILRSRRLVMVIPICHQWDPSVI